MSYLLPALLALSLFLPVGADELWVSNQPFPGSVRGSGQDMMVELRMFVQVMNIEADDQGDVVVIGGFPIPVEEYNGVRYVHLRDMVDAARLKISANPELGTVDVRRSSAGTGYKGEWDALSPSDGAENRIDGTATEVAGDFFSVKIPAHLFVVADPRYLVSGESENAKASSLNDYYSPMGAETVCGVAPDLNFTEGGLMFSFLPGLPDKLTAAEEKEFLDMVKSEVLRGGGQLVGPVASMSIAGNRFHRIRSQINRQGKIEDTELNIHFSTKHQVMVLLMIRAPKHRFNRVAPQLRLVVNNFRIK